MLVLTRDLKDSTLLIGDDIEVKVVNVKGNQVRLAISAPDDVNIVRTELLAPEDQPKNLPEIEVKKKQPQAAQEMAAQDEPRKRKPAGRDGNRRRNGYRTGGRGYQEPRQLTPNYASAAPDMEETKPEKVPVISLKRRRKTSQEEGAG